MSKPVYKFNVNNIELLLQTNTLSNPFPQGSSDLASKLVNILKQSENEFTVFSIGVLNSIDRNEKTVTFRIGFQNIDILIDNDIEHSYTHNLIENPKDVIRELLNCASGYFNDLNFISPLKVSNISFSFSIASIIKCHLNQVYFKPKKPNSPPLESDVNFIHRLELNLDTLKAPPTPYQNSFKRNYEDKETTKLFFQELVEYPTFFTDLEPYLFKILEKIGKSIKNLKPVSVLFGIPTNATPSKIEGEYFQDLNVIQVYLANHNAFPTKKHFLLNTLLTITHEIGHYYIYQNLKEEKIFLRWFHEVGAISFSLYALRDVLDDDEFKIVQGYNKSTPYNELNQLTDELVKSRGKNQDDIWMRIWHRHFHYTSKEDLVCGQYAFWDVIEKSLNDFRLKKSDFPLINPTGQASFIKRNLNMLSAL